MITDQSLETTPKRRQSVITSDKKSEVKSAKRSVIASQKNTTNSQFKKSHPIIGRQWNAPAAKTAEVNRIPKAISPTKTKVSSPAKAASPTKTASQTKANVGTPSKSNSPTKKRKS